MPYVPYSSCLVERLYNLPVDLLAARLVRPLLARFVLLDPTADECLVPHLLTPYKGDFISPSFSNLFRKAEGYTVLCQFCQTKSYTVFLLCLHSNDTLIDFVFCTVSTSYNYLGKLTQTPNHFKTPNSSQQTTALQHKVTQQHC